MLQLDLFTNKYRNINTQVTQMFQSIYFSVHYLQLIAVSQ